MLIGVSGKKGAGKDLAGEIIQRVVGEADFAWHYNIKKFADKIKDVVCLLIGCSREDLENREFKERELGEEWGWLTPRKLLQLLGTEAGRVIIHPNLWVNALFSDYDSSSNYDSKWIITDVRFPNECQAIKDRGGIVIRINRDSDVVDNHSSETALDNYYDFDHVVDNNGSIDDLTNNLIKIINND
tara:strand:+ start:1547 stop:2104 length:558 start_codon:yes stop_codon:yes gene_type:complete